MSEREQAQWLAKVAGKKVDGLNFRIKRGDGGDDGHDGAGRQRRPAQTPQPEAARQLKISSWAKS
jgi:hypothetical protein